MEICLSLTSPGLSVPDLAALAAWSEDLGYRTAWLAEVAGPEAFVLASATAAATEEMAVGVAAVPAYTRTPALLAMAAASVSQVLGGRAFRLGIGSSSETIVSEWNGLPFQRPLARVRETVQAVRAALRGETSFEGSTVVMRRFRLSALPSGPVELLVAALGPAMLRVAGAVGDGVCLNLAPARVVPRQLEEVRQGAAEAGREPPGRVMSRLQVMVTDEPASARTLIREQLLAGYLAQPVYNRFLRWIGYEEEADAIAAGWAARDRQAVHQAIHDELVDDLVLIGSAAQVRSRLEELSAAGVTEAAVGVLSPDRRVVEATLRALAPDR